MEMMQLNFILMLKLLKLLVILILTAPDESWEYLDSWAYKVDGAWTYGGS